MGSNLNIDIKVTTGSVLPAMAKVELLRNENLLEEKLIGGIGQYSFAGLREGEYTVVVNLPGFVPESRTALLRNGMQATVSFMLRPLSAPATILPADPVVDQRWVSVPPKAQEEIQKARDARKGKEFKKAIEHSKAAMALDPNATLALHELALAYWKSGAKEDARKAFEMEIQRDPAFLNSYLALADMLVEDKKYGDAGNVLMQASKAQPNRAEVFKSMAQIQLDTGHPEKAQQACELGLARDHSRVPEIYVVLANAHLRMGNQDKAVEALRSYLEKAPSGEMAEQVRTTLAKLKVK